jgi:hypothetical protein
MIGVYGYDGGKYIFFAMSVSMCVDWTLRGVYIILSVSHSPAFYGHSNDSSPFSLKPLSSLFHALRARVVRRKGYAPVAFCHFCAFVLVGLVGLVVVVELDGGFGFLEGRNLRGAFGGGGGCRFFLFGVFWSWSFELTGPSVVALCAFSSAFCSATIIGDGCPGSSTVASVS